MEHTVFRRPWRSPRYCTPANSSVPVRPVETESPRVVSIPVHFVASARARTAAAERIQRVFRGFVLRKNVKKIVRVASEADRIDQAMSAGEISIRIRQDPRERLRVNESLMSLLFQLDAVHGIDPAVRDLRKAVIRKVIALQESVDAIALQGTRVIDVDRDGSREGNGDIQGHFHVNERQKDVDRSCLREGAKTPVVEDQDCKIVNVVLEEGIKEVDVNVLLDQTTTSKEEGTCERIIDDSLPPRNITETEESLKGERAVQNSFEVVPEVSNATEIPQTTRSTEKVAGSERCASMEGAIERVMAENEKLRSVIAEMCERNLTQSQLMSSLALRMEQLERVMRQQEMRKAKKKQKLAIGARVRTPN